MIASFLISLAPYMPFILSVLGSIFRIFGASRKTLDEYTDMIKKVNTSGLITLESHDRLLAHKEKILAELKAEEEAAKGEKPNEGPH
jgi:hypothetical protein